MSRATLYAACLSRLGLSQAEAAALHGNSLATIKARCQGKIGVPQGCWDELRAYEARIVEAADEMLATWDAHGQPPIEINSNTPPGLPLMAMADFVLSSDGPVTIGETAATAAAKRARGMADQKD